jgi:FtsH-binding integral membrane protein
MNVRDQLDDDEIREQSFAQQALSFTGHTLLALGTWIALMLLGYFLNPSNVPQIAILALSIAVPLAVGLGFNRFRQSELAPSVWLIGLIWISIVALWVLDMPTGPNQCFQCSATEKLSRTFLSLPTPSGLVDNDGPFLGTWPAAALLGYSIGARLGLRKSKAS